MVFDSSVFFGMWDILIDEKGEIKLTKNERKKLGKDLNANKLQEIEELYDGEKDSDKFKDILEGYFGQADGVSVDNSISSSSISIESTKTKLLRNLEMI